MSFFPLTKTDVEELVKITKDFKDGWNAQMLLDGIESGNLLGTTYKLQDKIVGFVTYSVNQDFAEIDDIFVIKEYRKNKIATSLLQDLIEKLKSKTQKIFLEVRESNLPAINLYQKFGFTKVSVRKNYYNDGENALVLVREN